MDDELEKNYRARIDSESYRGPYTEEEKTSKWKRKNLPRVQNETASRARGKTN